MTEKSKGDLTVADDQQLPAYLREFEGETGLESADGYIVPPRLKIVQPQSHPPLIDRFSPGDVVLMPSMDLVAKAGEPFDFTTVFWFPEWCAWNPIQLKGKLPAVAQRTFDPDSELARKCQDPDAREEPCPEKPELSVRNCEHLVFMMILDSVPSLAVVHSFMRAEHKTGSSLLAKLRMRKAPIWACRFTASTSRRSNDQGTWHGFDVDNCESQWTPPELAEGYRLMYESLRDGHAKGAIQVDYDDEVATSDVKDTAEF